MAFDLHIGIDYSGEGTITSRLRRLQVYAARDALPEGVRPPVAAESRIRNWTRWEVTTWLIEQAQSGRRFIAGIDHGFSFPISYFEQYRLTSWPEFLDDFSTHWPTDADDTSVAFIRIQGDPDRTGQSTAFRLTEKWTSSAKSVFSFGGRGSVATSTHAGIPLLRRIRQELGGKVHFWPFDGWAVPKRKSVIAEVYPSIFKKRYPRDEERTDDQHDAYAIARWLKENEERGFLKRYFDPPLTDEERRIADLEGWILGIV